MSRNHLRIMNIGESFDFNCLRCDLCCGTGPNVSLTVFDVIRISKYLDVSPKDFLKIFANVIIADFIPVIVLKGDFRGRCVFLGFNFDGKSYCKIYNVRPLKCRLYPIKVISPKSKRVALDEECPGLHADSRKATPFPLKLYIAYTQELSTHYKMLYNKIFDEGMEPLSALISLIDELVEHVKKGDAYWINESYLRDLEDF